MTSWLRHPESERNPDWTPPRIRKCWSKPPKQYSVLAANQLCSTTNKLIYLLLSFIWNAPVDLCNTEFVQFVKCTMPPHPPRPLQCPPDMCTKCVASCADQPAVRHPFTDWCRKLRNTLAHPSDLRTKRVFLNSHRRAKCWLPAVNFLQSRGHTERYHHKVTDISESSGTTQQCRAS